MEVWKKITAGTLLGGVIIGGVIYIPKLIRLKNASPELDVIPSAKIHKVDLTGLTIRIDIKLKNPTPAAFKMKYPYVRLTYKGTTVGTSQSVNKDIEMTGLGEANIEGIMMNVTLMNMLSVAGPLLKAVKANDQIQIDITTITHIDPYWKYDDVKKEWKKLFTIGKHSLIPFSKTQTVTLKKASSSVKQISSKKKK